MRREVDAMTTETEQAGRRDRPAWQIYCVGVLSGVLVCFIVLVVLALKYGPYSENALVDLYSGHLVIQKHFFWARSQISEPNAAHVRWAIAHQDTVRGWSKPVCGTARAGWFEGRSTWDSFQGDWVLPIYSLQIAEEEKVKLLRQYHEELDSMRLKEIESGKSMESFHKDWERRLRSYRETSSTENP
jgi:hypothetical protein